MAFNYFEVRLKSGVVERVRDLTESAAYIRDNAAFAKLTSLDKTATFRGASDVLPETEDLARGHLDSIKPTDREPKIVYLSRDKRTLLGLGFGPERCNGCRDDGQIRRPLFNETPYSERGPVLDRTARLKKHRLQSEDRGFLSGGYASFDLDAWVS